jgi:hypothetical protein
VHLHCPDSLRAPPEIYDRAGPPLAKDMPAMIETEPMKLALEPTPEPAPATPEPAPAKTEPSRSIWIVVALIFVAGILVRLWPSAGFTGTGFDEALYRDNVIKLDKVGIFNYPEICKLYIEDQRNPDVITKLPPTRFFYIGAAAVWKRLEFGDAPPVPAKSLGLTQRDPALISLHRIAALFSCLGFLVGGLFTWRLLGLRALPGVLALLAVSPLSIHLGQHAMIDGVFTFWAMLNLWLLWENLQQPNNVRLLAAYAVSLAFMVVTKENSFFVYLALCGLTVTAKWAKFGFVTRQLLIVSVAGPALGLITLILLAGGVGQFAEIYRLLVSKAQNLTYAIKTGDGPWYRYLVDLMILSPIVLLFAVGGVFTQLRQNRAFVYLVAFVGFSYLIMCNIRYGMNLRYASIWDLPLRALAAAQVGAVATRFGKWQTLAASLGIFGLCAYDLRQYLIFFSDGQLYELATGGLLYVVKILK